MGHAQGSNGNMEGGKVMNQNYRQALEEVERLRENARLVDPEFFDVVDLELASAERRLMNIIKEAKNAQ